MWGRYITTAISTRGVLCTELCAVLRVCPFSVSLWSADVISSSVSSALCLSGVNESVVHNQTENNRERGAEIFFDISVSRYHRRKKSLT